MKLDAVIFDLDGTLIDSEPNYWEADRQFVERFGGTYDEDFRNDCVGMGSRNFVLLIKEKFELTQSVEELLDLKNKLYLKVAQGRTKAFHVAMGINQARNNSCALCIDDPTGDSDPKQMGLGNLNLMIVPPLRT